MAAWVWAAAVNLLLLILMGVDKSRARRKMWRIRERTLIVLALLGGSLGGILGMAAFRHKTEKTKFSLGFPAIFLAQLGLLWYLLK